VAITAFFFAGRFPTDPFGFCFFATARESIFTSLLLSRSPHKASSLRGRACHCFFVPQALAETPVR
jgi:hypothetical protein